MPFLLFLQQVAPQIIQQVPTAPQEIVSSSTLLIAIGTALVAIGGLIAWAIRSIIPKLIENFDKRTDSMVGAMKAIPDTIDGLKTTVVSLKEAMVSSNNTVINSVEAAKNDIINEVRDEKLRELLRASDRFDHLKDKEK